MIFDSPYRTTLSSLKGQHVTINRRHAPDVSGTLKTISEEGCEFISRGIDDYDIAIFIAFQDICGVSYEVLSEDAMH